MACPCGSCLWGPQALLHCRAPSPFHPLSRDMESAQGPGLCRDLCIHLGWTRGFY